MNNYQEKKENLLSKSDKQKEIIDSLLKSDGEDLIFIPEHRNKIEELQKKSNALLNKIKKDEFEIAIIGQENCGKSSLLNALIKTDMFPSADGRLTFTSSKLISAIEDKVEIETYSYYEFDKYICEKLEDINITNYGFEGGELKYFKEDYQDIYKSEISKEIKDIESIFKNKNKISKLLESYNGKTIVFKGKNLNQWKEFVTGIEEDKTKPQIVKNITIYSSKLQAMPNAIINDVPGFNSPTAIHKSITNTMLKRADSIIFITDIAKNPNLEDDELDIIEGNRDIYGIPLKDKLFIFGNKLDNANSQKIANNGIKKFRNDVENSLGSANIFFAGSAGKYLKEHNIGNQNIDFKNWAKDLNPNIDEFRSAIETYYETTRFHILKSRIENIDNDILSIFSDIKNSDELQNIDEDMDEEDLIEEIKRETERRIEVSIEKSFYSIRDNLSDKFLKDTPFAKKITEEISNFFEPTTIKEIRAFATEERELSYTHINFRQKIFNELLKDFSAIVTKSVEHQTTQIEADIFENFVSSVKNNNEIKELAEPLFKQSYQSQEGKFDYLLERFGRRVLDSIIRYPVGISDRKKAFYAHKEEFIFLDSRSIGLEKGAVISMIATGNNKALSENESVKTFSEKLITSFKLIVDNPQAFTQNFYDTLLPELKELESNQNSIDYDELFKTPTINSLEDIVEEINNDIENFKLILEKSIIPTLDLEVIFMGRVDKEIRDFIEQLKTGKMDRFIRKSVKIIAKDRLANVKKEIEINEAKSAIKKEIEKFLNEH